MGAAMVAVTTAAAFVVHVRRAPNPLVQPALFRDRTFTVVNIGTVFLYAVIGLTFFLVAYELQVGAGWTALRAGIAMLPTTALMLVLSSRSGALAQRIGPRLQLTIGPLLTAAGILLLTRVGSTSSWATDVLPGAVVLGIGLVTLVAPLTATVMAAADPAHVSIASGVNNAVARAASLAGLALVPVVSGLSTATGAGEVTHAYRIALIVSAATAAVAGPVMLLGLPARARSPRTARRLHCAVDGPPLQAGDTDSVELHARFGGRLGHGATVTDAELRED
jgi:MFS family permease